MKGGVAVVKAESSQARSVVGLVLSLIVEVKLTHGDAVSHMLKDADVLFVLQMAYEFVGVFVVAYKHGMALEGIE